MAYRLDNRSLTKVGVVGSGQIGPDIALHMTKVLEPHGARVVVVDIYDKALDAGRKKLDRKVDRGIETGAFSAEQGPQMKANVLFTEDYEALRDAELVIEAATEDLTLKRRLFSRLEDLVGPETILASNSSHLEPERIFAELRAPARSVVAHYFFPAERNPIVEVVPGEATEERVTKWLLSFYEQIGKVPLRIGSRYGYAIDPIFEGLFQAAANAVEEGLGSTREVDEIARRVLGLGVGPFTAMNLTGGNPITAHGLDEMHERVHPWFRTPELMRRQIASGEPWEVPARGERVEIPSERAKPIEERMLGAYFGLVNEVLSSGITNIADLELGVSLALAVRPPFAFMNALGIEEALERVRAYHRVSESFPVGSALVDQAASGEPWKIPCVLRRDRKGVAVLTIRRPQVLNALNDDVFDQLAGHLRDIASDDAIVGVVLTGFGQKAFVSGADVSMLAAITSVEEGERMSLGSHEVLIQIEDFPKPVICAYNGLAFGGGNELGMACHARLARKGLAVLAAQPEPNLGIIPGAGATQRLPRLVGLEKAWPLLRTGRAISSAEALEMGLVRDEVEGDPVETAAALARDVASGEVGLSKIPREPIQVPPSLPDVDIGHRSRAVDAILQKAILEGARLPLAEALRYEAKCFGEVCGLADMRIGVTNFIENGPRAKAKFEHR
ncbi:MAG TPA: 3-hydroxyacyl-CoA dehydrogenase NAD-binding domain-containing protein [Vicinamibacteria bacterium]|nr:3-hydroxyacyl-CoA dehydrogenase NAD-binding domain-containing protein [Vicinamibacteria bacterium]